MISENTEIGGSGPRAFIRLILSDSGRTRPVIAIIPSAEILDGGAGDGGCVPVEAGDIADSAVTAGRDSLGRARSGSLHVRDPGQV